MKSGSLQRIICCMCFASFSSIWSPRPNPSTAPRLFATAAAPTSAAPYPSSVQLRSVVFISTISLPLCSHTPLLLNPQLTLLSDSCFQKTITPSLFCPSFSHPSAPTITVSGNYLSRNRTPSFRILPVLWLSTTPLSLISAVNASSGLSHFLSCCSIFCLIAPSLLCTAPALFGKPKTSEWIIRSAL